MNNLINQGPFLFKDVIKIFKKYNIMYIPGEIPFSDDNYTIIVDDNYNCKLLVKKKYGEKLIWNEHSIDKRGKSIYPFEILVKKYPEMQDDINKLKSIL